MVNWSFIEKMFYLFGSSIAFVLGFIKLKSFWERPKIRLRIYFFFKKKEINEYAQDKIPLEYECWLLNLGKDIVGELFFETEGVKYILGGLFNLQKNSPKEIKGVQNIIPGSINIKAIKTPFKAKVFFQDFKGRKYALHEVTLEEGFSGWSETKESF